MTVGGVAVGGGGNGVLEGGNVLLAVGLGPGVFVGRRVRVGARVGVGEGVRVGVSVGGSTRVGVTSTSGG
jgi:hypothetical protein